MGATGGALKVERVTQPCLHHRRASYQHERITLTRLLQNPMAQFCATKTCINRKQVRGGRMSGTKRLHAKLDQRGPQSHLRKSEQCFSMRCGSAEGRSGPKALSPQAKREAVTAMQKKTKISERRACALVGLSRTVLHYQGKAQAENEQLQARMVELAGVRRRFGYRRFHALLRREGIKANHKRICRLYQDAGLVVKRRRRRHGVAVEREQLALPSREDRSAAHLPWRGTGIGRCAAGEQESACKDDSRTDSKPQERLPAQVQHPARPRAWCILRW